jgi:hypothetical protein
MERPKTVKTAAKRAAFSDSRNCDIAPAIASERCLQPDDEGRTLSLLCRIGGGPGMAHATSSVAFTGAVNLDAGFRNLTSNGNDAFAFGDPDEARRLYMLALEEADRPFRLASEREGQQTFRASLLAPMMYTIGCQNAAALQHHVGDHNGALQFEIIALSRLVDEAECVANLPFLRLNCLRHMKFALASIIRHLSTTPAEIISVDSANLRQLLSRIRTLTPTVAKIAIALARSLPIRSQTNSAFDKEMIDRLFIQISRELEPMVLATERLIAGFSVGGVNRAPSE